MQRALAAGEFEELAGGRFRVAGHELEPGRGARRARGREGWAVALGDGVTVALDLALDDDLLLEGEAYELIHRVNSLRKEQGFELTDRIVLTVPEEMRELIDAHGEWIAGEVLATEIRVAGDELDAREELSRGPLGAAQLDGQLEADVLVHGRQLAHLGAALTEPDADLARRAARAPRRRTSGRPSRSPRASSRRCRGRRRRDARRLPPRERPRRAAASSTSCCDPITSRRSTSDEQLLHRPLPVRGRVADVLARRRLDVGEAPAQDRDDLLRLVHRQRRLRDVRERRPVGELDVLGILGRLDEHDRRRAPRRAFPRPLRARRGR